MRCLRVTRTITGYCKECEIELLADHFLRELRKDLFLPTNWVSLVVEEFE